MILDLHHIQLVMPVGGNDEARRFYALLGFEEEPQPEVLRGRGGVWFRAGHVSLHMGVEEAFHPARKAHPAFRVASLEVALERLRAAGIAYRPDVDLPGIRRVHLNDPFGNRIELLEQV
ncbi:VOC family protein [Falsirhodobacter sp. 1013]|uniref:VOC family protein n=1 Tax=Falsirhodobacter sp. 1013 TaxID=3417566 RepID=UPI003EBB5940